MRTITVVLTGLILAGATTFAVAEDVQDEYLQRAIEHGLQEEEIRGVTVAVDGGTVTLSGEVESLWALERAEMITAKHLEVEQIHSELSIGDGPGDAELSQDIADRLSRYVHYSIFDDVNVRVEDGIVTLDGYVTWGFKANEIKNMAARVPGVETVVNEIEVLPPSNLDQQIRHALATEIYGHPMFVRYSSQVVPPVHIIVEDGRVTLTGTVDSNVQRRQAEHIARGTFGVFSVDNQLRVDPSS